MDAPSLQIAPGLLNRMESPGTKVDSCLMSHPSRYSEDSGLTDLTEEEMAMVVHVVGPTGNPEPLTGITLVQGCSATAAFDKTFKPPIAAAAAAAGFTVRALFEAIAKFEAVSRPQTEWFGGVDTHHVFFEGLYEQLEVGALHRYGISWGS